MGFLGKFLRSSDKQVGVNVPSELIRYRQEVLRCLSLCSEWNEAFEQVDDLTTEQLLKYLMGDQHAFIFIDTCFKQKTDPSDVARLTIALLANLKFETDTDADMERKLKALPDTLRWRYTNWRGEQKR